MGKMIETIIWLNIAVLGAQLSVGWDKAFWQFSGFMAIVLYLIEYLRERRK